MVWEVKPARGYGSPRLELSEPGPDRAVRDQTGQDTSSDQALELLHCDEHLAFSPGDPTSDSHMEYDDLPELQEVLEDQSSPAVFQVGVCVSHQERDARTHTAPPDTHWLTQLAHIATGPQSPLLEMSAHSRSSPVHILGTSNNLHSYARPPLTSSSAPSPSTGRTRERRRVRASSECESAISGRSSLSDDEDMDWCHSWPPTSWHCFLKGTRLRFHKGPSVEWLDAEELGSEDESDDEGETAPHPLKGYGSEGLALVGHAESVSSGQAVFKLTFDPGAFGEGLLTAECQLDHPFYVKNKGWASFYPSLTVVHYGIPCYDMQMGDLCLPPGHRDAAHTDDSLVLDAFRSYDFTPLDSSAVYVLSSMARQRRTSQSSGGAVSPDRDRPSVRPLRGSAHPAQGKPTKSQQAQPAAALAAPAQATPVKCKRPMNAFMLFAKKFRVEYTQMYPGKDNRAISVILGERWKKMKGEERRVYTMEAKALAEEQKRLNPDCWKRKRNNSGSLAN